MRIGIYLGTLRAWLSKFEDRNDRYVKVRGYDSSLSGETG